MGVSRVATTVPVVFLVLNTLAIRCYIPSKAPKRTPDHRPAKIQHRSDFERSLTGCARSTGIVCDAGLTSLVE